MTDGRVAGDSDLAEFHDAAESILKRGLTCVDSHPALKGRNLNRVFRDAHGRKFLIKQLRNEAGVENRMHLLEDAQNRLAEMQLDTPKLIGVDKRRRIVAYEFSTGEPLQIVLRAKKDSDALWANLGRALGRLHSGNTGGLPAPHVDHRGGSSDPLLEFSFADFWTLSAAEIELWRELQHVVRTEGLDLRAHPDVTRPVLVHYDLRLDQTLCRDDQVLLLDWEELRAGDRTRDLGMLFGDILSEAIYGLLEHLDSAPVRAADAVEVRMAEAGFRARRGIERVVDGYLQSLAEHDALAQLAAEDLLEQRVARHMFRHLLERVASRSAVSTKLTGIDRGILAIAMEIARQLPGAANAFGFNFSSKVSNA